MAFRYGTSAITLICDVLTDRGVCDYPRAFELAQAVDRELSRCGWIDTQEGIVFSRDNDDGRRDRQQLAF